MSFTIDIVTLIVEQIGQFNKLLSNSSYELWGIKILMRKSYYECTPFLTSDHLVQVKAS